MTFFRPLSAAEKQKDAILALRQKIARELRASNPSLSPEEVEQLVVLKLQSGPPPQSAGIPQEVLKARRAERRDTVRRRKSSRAGDKRPGNQRTEPGR